MFLKYTFKLLKKYDKKATNPFLKRNYNCDNSKSLYEKTYIWVEKNINEFD